MSCKKMVVKGLTNVSIVTALTEIFSYFQGRSSWNWNMRLAEEWVDGWNIAKQTYCVWLLVETFFHVQL